jgi:hypothetical protein
LNPSLLVPEADAMSTAPRRQSLTIYKLCSNTEQMPALVTHTFVPGQVFSREIRPKLIREIYSSSSYVPPGYILLDHTNSSGHRPVTDLHDYVSTSISSL